MSGSADSVVDFAGPGMRRLDGDTAQAVRVAEAVIFASAEPISDDMLRARLPGSVDLERVMALLQAHYAHRGVNLVRVGNGWAFRTAADLSYLLSREDRSERKLSRAALEVLAIIAYHQPVTRAELEEIRGVETAKGTLDTLLETGWIRMRGRRRTPGRPVTYGTTPAFLDQFGLAELRDLPGVDELRGAGLLSMRMPGAITVPLPPADAATPDEDEEPLSDIDLEELGLLPPRADGD